MKIVINPAYKQFESFVKSVPDIFNNEGVSIYAARNHIKVFEVDGVKINVKQYHVPFFINRIIYTFFRPSKASRAYEYGLKLISKGFETPEPIAYIQQRKSGLIHYTYFISFQSLYSRNMYEFGEGSLDGRENIVRSLARYTARLHEADICHKDYSPGNILFKETDGKVSFCLVDINRMSFKPVPIEKGCANFARLWGNEEMFRIMAREYANERKANLHQCIVWVLYYRERFWLKYKRKHEMPFSL